MGEVPQDIDAEAGLLGTLLLQPGVLDDVGRVVDASDFYSPGHRAIYDTVCDLWADGSAIDATTVSGRLRDSGELERAGGQTRIVSMLASAPSSRHASGYALRVVEKANARRALKAASEAADALLSGAPVDEVVDALVGTVSHLDSGDLDAPVNDVLTFEDWIATADTSAAAPWVVPGMFRSDWRMILTAPAGAGKATLLRQIAYAAACGIHPFQPDRRITPVRTMIIDLENPVSTFNGLGARMIRTASEAHELGRDREECMTWHRLQGIDVLTRRDRAELERRVRHAQPKLVVIGPLYKAYRKDSRRQSDDIAEEVCSIFDDLRTRYGFALLIEHHTARGSENLAPFGSSVWERWPEFGRTLKPEGEGRYKFGSFRPDRATVKWPVAFVRSSGWPWAAHYPEGL